MHTINLANIKEAMDNYNEAIRKKPDDSLAYYNKACFFALQKNDVQACNWLRLAIEQGYSDWKHINEDKDFDNIRNASCLNKLKVGEAAVDLDFFLIGDHKSK